MKTSAFCRSIHQMPRGLRLAVGGALVTLGVVGLLAPILPGWIFLIPGVYMVAPKTHAGRWMTRRALRVRHRLRNAVRHRHGHFPAR